MKNRMVFFCWLFLCCSVTWAQDQERILRYHSDIEVFDSGVMRVSETIRVQSNGDRIRHGIFRALPTRYRDQYGNRYVVPLSVVAASRDGVPEKYSLKAASNGVNIYLGDADVDLTPGIYTFIITYETDRQVGFFNDHDELYWNVTGNGWEFSIDSVSAAVTLPAQAAARLTGWSGFTGAKGSREKSVGFLRLADGRFLFTATRSFIGNEGLTILLTWPRSFVQRPDRKTRVVYFIKDNLGFVVGLLGLAGILLFYYLQWVRVGRDPKKGVILPQFQPPEMVEPEAVRYIMRMGFDDKTFAAFVLNLAVKGNVLIHNENGVYSIQKTKTGGSITAAERSILDTLFSNDQTVELKNSNHRQIQAAITQLKKQLTTSYYKRYFQTNRRNFWPGVALSVLVVIGSALSFASYEATFLTFWLSFWSAGVIVLVNQVFRLWRTAVLNSSARYASIAGAIFMTLFSIPFIAGELFGLFGFISAASPGAVVVIFAVIFVNYLFNHLLKAPSPTGRKVMDHIEGFKMYLAAAERERWNTLYPPDRTPQLFEKYLPYALALEVEQQWSQQFAEVIQNAGQMRENIAWYQTGNLSDHGLSSFTSSLSSSFSSAISSSSSAPGSSSGGGGGGSSGGGGGGGGGGGW